MNLQTALRLDFTLGVPVVALIGAGGKTSLLFRLGDELAACGRRVLLTASTRLAASEAQRAPLALFSPNPAVLTFELPTSLRAYSQVLALAGPADEPGKLAGLPLDAICRLAHAEAVEAVVVEADGSRGRPLKVPAQHEPVVPPCATHVVGVAGMAAAGQPLTDDVVQRAALAGARVGLPLGTPLDAGALAALLLHPAGGLKGGHPSAVRLLYLNLACAGVEETEQSRQRSLVAAQVARRVLQQPGYDAVLLGSAQAAEPVEAVHSRVAAVVLAAGAGRRLGSYSTSKPLLPWQGDTLVGRVVDIAAASDSIQDVVVVTGYRGDEVQAALASRPARVIHNPHWQMGQSSSVRAGLATLTPGTAAVVFLLADQPTVQTDTINRLVQRHRQTLARVIAPVYEQGGRGNPVLFDRTLFAELAVLEGDIGGRALIARHEADVEAVAVAGPAPRGIETPSDYHAALAGSF